MDVNELRSLIAVADHGSVKAAARALELDPSTIRRRLDALEVRFESPLLMRGRRGSELTQVGMAVVARARRLVAESERLLELGRTDVEPQGGVTVYSVTGMPATAFGMVARLLADTMPRVRVSFTELEDPLAGDLDDADLIVHWTPRDPGPEWKTVEIVRVPIRLLASPEYLSRRGRPVDVADLVENHRLLAWRAAGLPSCTVLDEAGSPKAFQPATTSASPLVLFHMAASGAGIAIAPEGGYPIEGLTRDALVEVTLGAVRETRVLQVSYRRALAQDPRVSGFYDMIERFAATREMLRSSGDSEGAHPTWFRSADAT